MLKQKLILHYFSRVFLQLMQIVASIIVARVAGPTVLGTVAFGTAYVNSLIFISDLNLGGAHTKLISEGQDEGNCIAVFAWLKLVTTSAFVLVVLGIYFFQVYFLKVDFESPVHHYVVFIALISAVLQSFLYIPEGTFGAKVEEAKCVIIEVTKRSIWHILRIIVVVLGYKALALALSNLVSLLLVIPLVWYLFKDRPKGVFDKDLAKKYIKISIPLIILSVAETLMVTFDKVLLQFFTNSEQVGYYTASYRIGGLFLIIVSGISIFFPLFSKAFAEGDLFYIKDKIDKYERIIFLFVMPTVLMITIYSDTIIKLILGNQYINSIVPMSIITMAIFIKVVTLPYSNVLTGKGLFKLTAKLSVVALVGFLGILCILVHPKLLNLKAKGAALAILLTHLLLGILYIIFARMNLKPLREIKNGKFVIFGIINFLFFFFLYNGLKDGWGLTFVIAFPFFYYTLTYLFLYKFKWIGESEMRIIKSVIDIKAIKEYVSSEIKGKGE